MKNKILLFIPMYNCEKQITRVLGQLTGEVCDYLDEVIIINNRSTDNGEEAVCNYLRENELSVKISLFRNDANYGLGGSHKVAFKYAVENNFDYVLIDTAGRLQIDETLMEELRNIEKERNPHETLLVIDSMMGQDAINVITGFNEKLSLTGVILTKLDGDTRGGVALSVRHLTNLPIKFMGISEKMDGLSEFHPERMSSRILGMGDILSLVEKVSSEIEEEDAEKLVKKMSKGTFDLEDFLQQLKQMKKLGPLENLIKLLPGAKKMGLDKVKVDPKKLIKTEAIIQSMTPYERTHPEILKASRKQRIAKGSGTTVTDVNQLINQFEDMKKMMKMMSNGNFKLPF